MVVIGGSGGFVLPSSTYGGGFSMQGFGSGVVLTWG